jgi:hypothetical protein
MIDLESEKQLATQRAMAATNLLMIDDLCRTLTPPQIEMLKHAEGFYRDAAENFRKLQEFC